VAVMIVKAWLTGRARDLQLAKQAFASGDPVVATEDKEYYLASRRLNEVLPDASRLYDIAQAELTKVNGVARLIDSGFLPVQLTGSFGVGDVTYLISGDRSRTFEELTELIESLGRKPSTPPSLPGAKYVALAGLHPEVAETLAILGKPVPKLDWFDLYKIYEIIRDQVGSHVALNAKNWVAPADLRAFTASANRPDVSGLAARHARVSGAMPRHSISLDEARALITKLVRAWIDSL
jgi:hypothetical protein